MELNKYELGVVVRADLDQEAFTAEMDRVKATVERFGGNIEKIDEWGRRKLAYPIQKLSEGMYTFITYTAEGNTAAEIENRLRIMENVLRFMTIRKDEADVVKAAAAEEVVVEEAAVVEEVVAAEETEPVEEAIVEAAEEVAEQEAVAEAVEATVDAE